MLVFAPSDIRPKADFKSKDIYKFYVKRSENSVSSTVFNEVVKEYFEEFVFPNIILENYHFRMPFRLGGLMIKKYKRFNKMNN